MRRSAKLDNSNVAEAFDGIRADYNAAKISRYRRRRGGTLTTGSHADWHYRVESDYLRIMEQARDFDRNDCFVGQLVDRAVNNTLQGGMTLDAETGDSGADDALESRWQEWSCDPEQCEVSGEFTFPELESLALRHVFVDGDVIAIGTDDGQLQMMEAHRLRTPSNTRKNVVHGILLDNLRRHLEYWFCKEDVSPNVSINRVSDMDQIPVRNSKGIRQVFHALFPKRLSQTRGVSAFAPVFDCAGIFEDLNFAKLVQAQVASCFAIFRERELNYAGTNNPVTGEATTENPTSGPSRTVEGIVPGMELRGEPGEKITGFSPNIPNQEFFMHVRLILTLIGVNLGMPLVLSMMDASETNFSGYRGAVDQARLGFTRNQSRLIKRFHKPIYEFKVSQWLAEDAGLLAASKRSDVNILGHRWTPPRWPYIQPLQDAATDLMRIRNNLISPRRLFAERGMEWEDVAVETVEDNAHAITTALKKQADIESKFPGCGVQWRDLLPSPPPDGFTGQIPTDMNAGEQSAPPKAHLNGFSRNGFHA